MSKIQAILAMILFTGIFFLTAEGALRLLRFPPVLIGCKVRAINEDWRKTKEFRDNIVFNSLGIRGKKEIPPKTQDAYRILCVGDSWTFGLNVSAEKSYPAFLERFLKKNRPKMNAEVINAGIPGKRIEEMRLFLEKNIKEINPECVILLGGENGIIVEPPETTDSRNQDFYLSGVGAVLAGSHAFNALLWAIEFAENIVLGTLKSILTNEKRKNDSEISLVAGFLDRLYGEGRAVLLLNYPLPKRSERVLRHKVQGSYRPDKDVALKILSKMHSKAEFVNLYDLMKNNPKCNGLFLNMYYTHPNEEGYKAMAELIGKRVLVEMDSSGAGKDF